MKQQPKNTRGIGVQTDDATRKKIEAERDAKMLAAYEQARQSGLPESEAEKAAKQAAVEWALQTLNKIAQKFGQ